MKIASSRTTPCASRFSTALSCLLVGLYIMGCGSSQTSSGTSTPQSPTITFVALACTPASIQLTATSACTSTVTGTGAYTSAVMYSVSPSTIGTISSAGVFTPATTGTATITAASTQPGYTSVSNSVYITVTQVPPTITSVTVSTAPSTIVYGQTAQCIATVTGTGAFSSTVTWTATGGTISSSGLLTPTGAGTPSCTATSTQDSTKSGSANITVSKATPIIAWSNPAAIVYGQALGATQLNATPSVPSSCPYTPAAGTVLTAGTQTLSVTCSPTDTANYVGATATVQLVVNKATPNITWPTPASITNTTPLSGTQLNATASTAGSFSYNPGAGTTLPVGTDPLSVTFTPTDTTDYNNATGSVQIVVTQAAATITSVGVSASPSSITNVQTSQCTATVTGTNGFSSGVTWSATGGTISSSGLFTPSGVGTGSCTATSTQDTSKSGSASITVTLRTITINAAVGNQWSASCFYFFAFGVAQTGITQGDNFYLNPYTPSSFKSTPANPFTVTMGLTNTGTTNRCSPGAYDMYVAGSDGAVSNHHYVPVVGRWNMWAGYNSTDEVLVDYAANTTCKYKLSDGTPDGSCIPFGGFESAVDGNYVVLGGIYNVVATFNLATDVQVAGFQTTGAASSDVSIKNNIVCYTVASETSITCFSGTATNGDVSSAYVNAAAGVAPTAIAMTNGCNAGNNAASAFIYDEASPSLQRFDLFNSLPNTFGEITVTGNKIGSLALGGLSPAIAVTNTLARFVATWDTNCRVAVLAPVATGTNPDGSTAYSMELALVDATAGSMRQLGTYVSSTLIPASVIRMAADPAGNAVVLAATNESAGSTNLVRVSWTLDASSNPTFTTTALTSAPAVGVYGVSLGVLPNGKISIGQRQTHSLLANQ